MFIALETKRELRWPVAVVCTGQLFDAQGAQAII